MTAWEQGTEIEYQHLGGLPATLDLKRCSHQITAHQYHKDGNAQGMSAPRYPPHHITPHRTRGHTYTLT